MNNEVIVFKPKLMSVNTEFLNHVKQLIKPENLNIGISNIKHLKNGGLAIGLQ